LERVIREHERLGLGFCLPGLEALVKEKRELLDNPVGNILKYRKILERMPTALPSEIRLDRDRVTVGDAGDVDHQERKKIRETLFKLCPWRKGPFELFGIPIDSEWASYIKWNRLVREIAPLNERRILDIGASNGYYMFKMAASAPAMVLGIDPQMLFYFQFQALQRFINHKNIFAIPAGIDELPRMDGYFDTVFCMGVIYHRKSPLELLYTIHDQLRKGGELVIETLIIETDDHTCLFPESRYAKMRNVFFIPGLKVMSSWLKRTGFTNIRCIDISPTTAREQGKTDWIQTESLEDFLDPENPGRTIEGYPAPVRAIFTANT